MTGLLSHPLSRLRSLQPPTRYTLNSTVPQHEVVYTNDISRSLRCRACHSKHVATSNQGRGIFGRRSKQLLKEAALVIFSFPRKSFTRLIHSRPSIWSLLLYRSTRVSEGAGLLASHSYLIGLPFASLSFSAVLSSSSRHPYSPCVCPDEIPFLRVGRR